MSTLTKRQKQILDYISNYIEKRGISPTFEEIKKHFKLSALSTIHQHVEALVDKCYLIKNNNSSRGLELAKSLNNLVQIPLVGTIVAGQPIEAIENKETIAIPQEKLPLSGNFYALRVQGDSMIDKNINDGDVVLVKQQNTADNGQKVVALIDNYEATLKIFYKEKGHIKLQPANKTMEPIIIYEQTPLAIQGLVIDVIKNEKGLQAKELLPQKDVKECKPKIINKIDQYINRVIQGDCLDVMPSIPDESVDMILCDLPYGHTQNKWDSIIPLDKLWAEYERIIKNDGVIALTSQGVFTAQLIMSNPKFFKYKIIWLKSKSTNFLNAKKQPLRKYEDICVFYKKQPTYNPQMTNGDPYNKGHRKNQLTGSYGDFNSVEVKSNGERYPNDVVYFKTPESEGRVYHPTQKPIDLGRYLIKTYTNKGDIVLDNACGSGSFLVSAVLEDRKFIGIEKNKEVYLHKKERVDYIKICNQRIKEALELVNTQNRRLLNI